MANRRVTEHTRRPGFEVQRAEILEAAAAAIAEHGFHGMSMRALAGATGRALASFYNYFPSKEDLLFSLQVEAFETMTESANAALAQVSEPVDKFYAFTLNHLRFCADRRAVMRVLVHEAAALPTAKRKTVRLLKEAYFNICRDIVASILQVGCRSSDLQALVTLDPAEVERMTYSVFGMLNWSYGWYDPKVHGTPEDVARTIHALAVCGLVARCPHSVAPGKLDQFLAATAPAPLILPKNLVRTTARKTSKPEIQLDTGAELCAMEK